MVQDWSASNKKRREEQMRLIQKRDRTVNPSFRGNVDRQFSIEHAEALPWNDIPDSKSGYRFLWQTCISVFFLFCTHLIFQSHSPMMKPAESVVYEVMTREFNFAGCTDLYNKYVGNMPSVLPVFSHKTSSEVPLVWKVPVTGKVVLPYDSQRRGVVIRAVPSAHVVASTEGWVTFAGYKKGFGNIVMIRHVGGHETWYGWLRSLDVKEKDWVQRGQNLGDVSLTKGQPLLYFALKKDQKFANPSDVIRFE